MKDNRYIEIINIFSTNPIATVNDISKSLKLSPSTVRRILTKMEKSGILIRTHGGAKIIKNILESLDTNEKTKNKTLKLKIAKYAASQICDGDIVSLNSSTITSLMPQFITAKNITIITNSIKIAYDIRNNDNINLIVLGGSYMRSVDTLEGPTTTNQIQTLKFDKAFLGANGIDINYGLCTATEIEASTKIATINKTDSIYFVCEHTKFDRSRMCKICDFKNIDYIITDDEITSETFSKFSQKCKIIRAK